MSEKQRTIKQECKISGVGLHTGNKVNLTLKPAKENEGIHFVRVDFEGKPRIKADLSNVLVDPAIPRCTSINAGDAVVHTIEHLMSVLCGLGIDNLTIEIDGNEVPGLDGSGKEFFERITGIGIVDQKEDKKYFQVSEPIGVSNNGSSIYMVPDAEFKISYTLDYDNPQLQSQFFSSMINQETFKNDIVFCRTFCLEKEAEDLRASGLGKGADYENTLVVGEKGVIDNKIHFVDEFARHKVLDFIGDLYLLGAPIKGHAFAIKSGHKLNFALLKELYKQKEKQEAVSSFPKTNWGDKKEFDIQDIMKILPHRYPFLMVDRIIELEKGISAVGIKNVTINDNFFQGHFPTKPIMPGVLMVEALAQVSGIVALTSENHDGKIALFMSTDNVKFRRIVSPGDQLVLHAEVVSDKNRFAKFHGYATVDDKVVMEADVMFSYVDASFLDE